MKIKLRKGSMAAVPVTCGFSLGTGIKNTRVDLWSLPRLDHRWVSESRSTEARSYWKKLLEHVRVDPELQGIGKLGLGAL